MKFQMTYMNENLIQIAKEIIDKADSKGLALKAFGRIGVAIACGMEQIETQDIDLFSLDAQENHLIRFFKEIEYPHKRVLPGMMVFWNNDKTVKVDVYLKELVFAFKIPGPFSPSNQYTIPITQLFLSKLYFSDEDWSDKEKNDLVNILRTHQIGRLKNPQIIQIELLQETWCCNSDGFANFSFCEKKLLKLLEKCDDEPEVREKIEYILEVIRKTPKKCPYKIGKCFHYGSPNVVEDAFLN